MPNEKSFYLKNSYINLFTYLDNCTRLLCEIHVFIKCELFIKCDLFSTNKKI